MCVMSHKTFALGAHACRKGNSGDEESTTALATSLASYKYMDCVVLIMQCLHTCSLYQNQCKYINNAYNYIHGFIE